MRIILGENKAIVNAELIKENFYTAWVRLPDGHFIKRKKMRDFIDFEKDMPKTTEPVKRVRLWDRLVNFIKRVIGQHSPQRVTMPKGELKWKS